MPRLPSADTLGPLSVPQSNRPIVGFDGSAIPRAVEGLGQMLGEQAKQQEGARAALSLASMTNDLHDAHDTVARGVLDGSIDPGQAGQAFNDAAAKVRETRLQGFSPAQTDQMSAHAELLSGSLARSLTGVVIKRQQSDTGATIDQFGEQVSRSAAQSGPEWAAAKYDSLVDFAGPGAGWTPEQIAAKKQAFRESTTYSYFDGLGTTAVTEGDSSALAKLLGRVQSPEGDALDPQKRAVLQRQLFGWQEHVLAKQAAAENADAAIVRERENAAVDVFNQTTDLMASGHYLSPDWITSGSIAVAGTGVEKDFTALLGMQKEVAGFASMSAPVRAAMLSNIRQRAATPGIGTDPAHAKVEQALTKLDDSLNTKAKDNPWVGAQSAGRIQDAQPLDVSSPPAALAAIQARMGQIGAVEEWANHRVSPLQPQEVEQVGKMVRQMPLDQAASMLAQIGTAVGDADRVAALGKQMNDKDGPLGRAMMYASAQTTEGRNTAELILRGDQAIKDKVVTIDGAAETGWKATIAKQIRGSFSNREAEDEYIKSAFEITAANYAKDGSADIDRAVRLATGGIVERNGQKFPLPYGMSEDDFNARVKAIGLPDLADQATSGQVLVGRTPMPLSDFIATLPTATLIHAGQGLYNVRAGTGLVTSTDGKRITIKVAP